MERSALVLWVAGDAKRRIQDIRAVRDKHFVRWPAHLTLFFPFVVDGDQVPHHFPATPPFDVSIDSFDLFSHGPKRGTTVFASVRPCASLMLLHAQLCFR